MDEEHEQSGHEQDDQRRPAARTPPGEPDGCEHEPDGRRARQVRAQRAELRGKPPAAVSERQLRVPVAHMVRERDVAALLRCRLKHLLRVAEDAAVDRIGRTPDEAVTRGLRHRRHGLGARARLAVDVQNAWAGRRRRLSDNGLERETEPEEVPEGSRHRVDVRPRLVPDRLPRGVEQHAVVASAAEVAIRERDQPDRLEIRRAVQVGIEVDVQTAVLRQGEHVAVDRGSETPRRRPVRGIDRLQAQHLEEGDPGLAAAGDGEVVVADRVQARPEQERHDRRRRDDAE